MKSIVLVYKTSLILVVLISLGCANESSKPTDSNPTVSNNTPIPTTQDSPRGNPASEPQAPHQPPFSPQPHTPAPGHPSQTSSHPVWTCRSPFTNQVLARVVGIAIWNSSKLNLDITRVGMFAVSPENTLVTWIDKTTRRQVLHTRLCVKGTVGDNDDATYVLEIRSVTPTYANAEVSGTLTRYRGPGASKGCRDLEGLLEFDQDVSLICKAAGSNPIQELAQLGRNPAPSQDLSYGQDGIQQIGDFHKLTQAIKSPTESVSMPSSTRGTPDGGNLVSLQSCDDNTYCTIPAFIRLKADGQIDTSFGQNGALRLRLPSYLEQAHHPKVAISDFHPMRDGSFLVLFVHKESDPKYNGNSRIDRKIFIAHVGPDESFQSGTIRNGFLELKHPNDELEPLSSVRPSIVMGDNNSVWVAVNYRRLRSQSSPPTAPEPKGSDIVPALVNVNGSISETSWVMSSYDNTLPGSIIIGARYLGTNKVALLMSRPDLYAQNQYWWPSKEQVHRGILSYMEVDLTQKRQGPRLILPAPSQINSPLQSLTVWRDRKIPFLPGPSNSSLVLDNKGHMIMIMNQRAHTLHFPHPVLNNLRLLPGEPLSFDDGRVGLPCIVSGYGITAEPCLLEIKPNIQSMSAETRPIIAYTGQLEAKHDGTFGPRSLILMKNSSGQPRILFSHKAPRSGNPQLEHELSIVQFNP